MADKQSIAELRRDISALRRTLADTRKALKGQPIVIPMDGTLKPNPAWIEFQKMMKEYRLSLKALDELEAAEKKPEKASNLHDMQNKFRMIV